MDHSKTASSLTFEAGLVSGGKHPLQIDALTTYPYLTSFQKTFQVHDGRQEGKWLQVANTFVGLNTESPTGATGSSRTYEKSPLGANMIFHQLTLFTLIGVSAVYAVPNNVGYKRGEGDTLGDTTNTLFLPYGSDVKVDNFMFTPFHGALNATHNYEFTQANPLKEFTMGFHSPRTYLRFWDIHSTSPNHASSVSATAVSTSTGVVRRGALVRDMDQRGIDRIDVGRGE